MSEGKTKEIAVDMPESGEMRDEAIKIVSGKDAPTNNVLMVDGKDGSAVIRRIPLVG